MLPHAGSTTYGELVRLKDYTVSPSISQGEVVDPGGRGQFPMIWIEETLIPMLPPSTPKKEFMVVMCMCAYGITVQCSNCISVQVWQ